MEKQCSQRWYDYIVDHVKFSRRLPVCTFVINSAAGSRMSTSGAVVGSVVLVWVLWAIALYLSLPQPFVVVRTELHNEGEDFIFHSVVVEKTIALPTGSIQEPVQHIELEPVAGFSAVQWTFPFKPTSRYTPR